MEGAFGRLYRTSKLASYDRSIKQIYTTYKSSLGRKEWGLKRRLPKKVGTQLVVLKSAETREQMVDFESANQPYLMVQSWKENFTASTSPKWAAMPEPEFGMYGAAEHPGDSADGRAARGPQRNLGRMSRLEWRRFLDEVKARRSEWKAELAKGNYAPEEALTFVNATSVSSSTSDGVVRSPTYHDYEPPAQSVEVYGRILNRTGASYAVAVQGIVATLPHSNYIQDHGFQNRDVKKFFVHSARFDNQGRPVVVLGINPAGQSESAQAAIKSSTGTFSWKGSQAQRKRRENPDFMKQLHNALELRSVVANQSGDKPAEGLAGPLADALDAINKTRR
ncbi:hypothetical protein GGF46_001084 [Coemansia sp. RSA 552]|nr:hypothetical protein GGF46_001084 [Coemansia sp. RSA 552]